MTSRPLPPPPSTVTLQPMADPELRRYRDWAVANLAEQLARARGISLDDCRALAEARVDEVLPHGRPRPGDTFALSILDGGARAGCILAGLDRELGPTRLFLYEIVIDDGAQGRGVGRAAMVALETFAAEVGAGEIALNVFGHNAGAQALYASMGYAPQQIGMAKRLAPAPDRRRPGA